MADAPALSSPPTLLAMIMCEQLLRDPESNRFYLMGTTTHTSAPAFPARYPRMCMYAVLTGIRGPTALTLRLVRPDKKLGEDVEIVSARGKVSANDPLLDAELTLNLRNLMFPQAGEYRFQLWAGASLLGERKFLVRTMTRRRNPPSDPPSDRPSDPPSD